MPLLCLFTNRCESRGPCSDGTPSVRHARKRREKAIVSDLGPRSPERMEMSRGVRKGRAIIDSKLCEAGCGLQKTIIFLSLKKAQGLSRGIKGGTVRSAGKGLTVRQAFGGDFGPSVGGSTGPRGQATVGGAEPARPGHTPSLPPPSVWPWAGSPASLSLSLVICIQGSCALCFLSVPQLDQG